jgi:hypothetical protein
MMDNKNRLRASCILWVVGLLFACSSFAQPTYQWVNATSVNTTLGSFAQTVLSPGSGTSFWYATLDTFVAGNPASGTFSVRRVDATGIQFSAFTIGDKVSIHEIKEIDGDVIVQGTFTDTLMINGVMTDIDTMLTTFITEINFIARIGANGNIVWYRNLTLGTSFGINVFCMALSPQKEVYLGTNQPGLGTRVIVLGLNGTTVDSFTVVAAANVSDIGFDGSGNIYIAGAAGSGVQWQVGNFSILCPYSYAIYMAKLLPGNIVKWVRFTQDITFARPKIVVNTDGSSYIAGDLSAPTQWDNIGLVGPQWVNDFYLARIDTAGFVTWVRELPLQQPNITGDFSLSNFRYLAVDDSLQVALYGFVRGYVDFGNGVVTPTALGTQRSLVTVMFDPMGNPIWSKSVANPLTPFGIIHQNQAWYASSATASGFNTVVLDTISIAVSGTVSNLLTRLSYNAPVVTSLGMPDTFNTNPFPNPSQNHMTFPIRNVKSVSVFDLQGRDVAINISIGADQVTLDVRDLVSGMYYVRIEDEHKKTSNFKIQVAPR